MNKESNATQAWPYHKLFLSGELHCLKNKKMHRFGAYRVNTMLQGVKLLDHLKFGGCNVCWEKLDMHV